MDFEPYYVKNSLIMLSREVKNFSVFKTANSGTAAFIHINLINNL